MDRHNFMVTAAEDDCDDDQCGGEEVAPTQAPADLLFGFLDTRPLLPALLVSSTALVSLAAGALEIPLLLRCFPSLPAFGTHAAYAGLNGVTLVCMLFCIFVSPGMVGEDEAEDDEHLPKRAKKSWQYPRAILRYDHYCRWLANSIGLLNHREFMVMVTGLVAIGATGVAVDCILLVKTALASRDPLTIAMLLLHVVYSSALLKYVAPIFLIHVGLISRSETANDWKTDAFYVMKGTDTRLDELSDADSILTEDKEYYPPMNEFDRGVSANCWAFWCATRWGSKGEF
mmetsp:Transcript_22807/g.77664  ORF Transcript_22807/g.77664 Transcript_22807/m.77664 type:complete len:287 (-) Transcript_22807:194-1054(-)